MLVTNRVAALVATLFVSLIVSEGALADAGVAFRGVGRNTLAPSGASGNVGYGTSHWPNYEARATYIVANIPVDFICNETLDANDGSVSGGNWFINPSVSTTYPCTNQGSSNFMNGAGNAGFVAANSLPGNSLSGAGYVFQIDAASGTANSYHPNLSWTDKTMCMRSTEMLETSFPVPVGTLCGSQPCDQKWKSFREHSGNDGSINTDAERNHPGFETSSSNSCNGVSASGCTEQWDYGAFTGSAFGQATTNWSAHGPVSLAELRGEWWRREVCWDHVASTGTMTGRGRMVRISDGLTVTNTATYPNSGVTTVGYTGSNGSNANYVYDFDAPNWSGGTSRRRHGSAAMIVVLTTRDPTFWIGGAQEIGDTW